jgi:hypothetical protein
MASVWTTWVIDGSTPAEAAGKARNDIAAAPSKGAASKLRRGTVSVIGSSQMLTGLCLRNCNHAKRPGFTHHR